MKLDDQVCSLELAKRLKELGVKHDSLFYYYDNKIIGGNDLNGYEIRTDLVDVLNEYIISAFTVAELGEMLPDCIDGNKLLKNNKGMLFNLNGHFIKSSKKDDEYKIYIDGLTKITIFFSKNEADARAKMLIYLLENGLIEDKKIYIPDNASSLVLGDENE